MKFNINQQDFQKSLNYCQGVIEKRSTLPILSNVLLEAANSKLKITATDISILLNVSRPTLSSWFDGTTSPTQDTHIHKVKILLAILV